MNNLHYIQLKILNTLRFNAEASFTDLNTEDLSSDHFNFHIKQLLRLGYIKKNINKLYSLTTEGLEIAGRIDSETNMLLNQPRVSVSLGILKHFDEGLKVLLGKRKKQPSLGLYAWHTKKIKIGESFFETCQRCLDKETGLKGEFEYMGTTHIIRKYDNKLEIDIVTVDFLVKNITGVVIDETDDHINEWVSIEEALHLENVVIGFSERLLSYKSGNIIFQEFVSNV